jgi:hypothetical protein
MRRTDRADAVADRPAAHRSPAGASQLGGLVDSNRDPKTGDCDDDDISVELTDVRRWLAEAREALK